MGFVGTAEVGRNALRQPLSREPPIVLNDLVFAMHLLGPDGIQPGTLFGQPEG
jgi:hypothetical protein